MHGRAHRVAEKVRDSRSLLDDRDEAGARQAERLQLLLHLPQLRLQRTLEREKARALLLEHMIRQVGFLCVG